MKKLLVILLALFITSSIHAQESTKETPAIFQKGRLMIGLSNLSFGHSKTIRDGSGEIVGGSLRLGGSLRTGLLVKDRWMLGVNLGYLFFSNRSSEFNYHRLNAGLFSRYYAPITKKLSFFTELNAGYGRSFSSNETGIWAHQDFFHAGASAGLNYQLNKLLSFEASMGYAVEFSSGSINVNSTPIRMGLNLHF